MALTLHLQRGAQSLRTGTASGWAARVTPRPARGPAPPLRLPGALRESPPAPGLKSRGFLLSSWGMSWVLSSSSNLGGGWEG